MTAEFCAAQRGRYIRPNIPGAPTRCEVAASTGPSDANRTAPPPRVAATPPGTPPSKPAASPPSNAVPPDNAGPGASRLPGVPRQPPELPTMPAGCEEAKVNIDWVMTRDFAARLNYRTARQSRSPLEAVIFAQRHNPNAQATIRRCAAWSGDYAAWLEKYAPEPGQPQGTPAADPKKPNPEEEMKSLDCLVLGKVNDNYDTMSRLARGAVPSRWDKTFTVDASRCKEIVRLLVCVRYLDGRGPQNEYYRYGPGLTSEGELHFAIYNAPREMAKIERRVCRPNGPCPASACGG